MPSTVDVDFIRVLEQELRDMPHLNELEPSEPDPVWRPFSGESWYAFPDPLEVRDRRYHEVVAEDGTRRRYALADEATLPPGALYWIDSAGIPRHIPPAIPPDMPHSFDDGWRERQAVRRWKRDWEVAV